MRRGTANGGVQAPQHPRRPEYRESKCNACCKTPFGCGRNYICDCHRAPAEMTQNARTRALLAEAAAFAKEDQ